MKNKFTPWVTLIILTLLVAACSPQATPATAPPTAMPPTQAPAATQPSAATSAPAATQAPAATSAPATGAAVDIGKNDKLGSFLVDDKGMTLYILTKDTPNTSTCYDKCAANWPPLLTTGGAPTAGDGVDASKFGTTTRTDNTVQVTYNGWPLYYYSKDKAAGDTGGEGVGSVWFVISPTGDKVEAQKPGY